jgi:hypothetical protein
MPESLSWFAIFAITTVSWGGLLFGYDIGIITSTIDATKQDIPMTAIEEGLVMSLIGAGSIFGALIAGPMCDILGRWKSIHIQNFCFITGALITCTAEELNSLYVGRFIIGIAAAISAIADVPYLLEISPSHLRGTITCTYEVMVSVGVLLSFLLGLVLYSDSNGWRVAYLIPVFMCIIQSSLMFWLPESPKWLLSKRKSQQTYNALLVIYGKRELDDWLVMVSTQHRANKRAQEMKEKGYNDDDGQGEEEEDEDETDNMELECVVDNIPLDIRNYYRLLIDENTQSQQRNRSGNGSHSPLALPASNTGLDEGNDKTESNQIVHEEENGDGLSPSQRLYHNERLSGNSCVRILMDCLPTQHRPSLLALMKEWEVMQQYTLLIMYVILIQTATQVRHSPLIQHCCLFCISHSED